jgi:NAD(P)-dependent dehydrogenase (short-subunit alcohol dehydrogenase family)
MIENPIYGGAYAYVALVTGASRGLGRNTAIALARKGIDVIGTYHSNKAEAAATASAIEALGRKAVMFQLDAGTAAIIAARSRRRTRPTARAKSPRRS